MNAFLRSSACAVLILATSPAWAQSESPKAKAQGGIGGYFAILSIAKLCNFSIEQTNADSILANVKALKPKAEMTEKELDAAFDETIASFAKDKAKYCGIDQATFNASIIEMSKMAQAQAEGSGAKLLALSAPVPDTVTGSDVEAIAAVARVYGEATVTKDKNGDPYIKGRTKAGATWSISFYGCEKGANCTSVEFWYGLESNTKTSPEKINEWNRTKRWSKAYIDKDGDPNISFDLNLKNGLSKANLDSNVDRWVDVVDEFKTFVTKK